MIKFFIFIFLSSIISIDQTNIDIFFSLNMFNLLISQNLLKLSSSYLSGDIDFYIVEYYVY